MFSYIYLERFVCKPHKLNIRMLILLSLEYSVHSHILIM